MIQTTQIRDNVYCIKSIAYNNLDFHGFVVRNEKGSSCNAYLVVDEQITLIDTVDSHLHNEFINAIKKIIGERPIDNLIINHTEPEHFLTFGVIRQSYPNMKCYSSKKRSIAMKQINVEGAVDQIVRTYDTISTGKYTFVFLFTKFADWPYSMVTLLKEEGLLFTSDIVGQLVTGNQVFDYEYRLFDLINSAKEYFANIIMPYSDTLAKKFDVLLSLGYEIKMMCPSHGVIWQHYIQDIVDSYHLWTYGENRRKKIVIVFDSIWGRTEQITNEIANSLMEDNYEVYVFNSSIHRPSLIMSEVLDADAVLVGSSNFNGTMLPSVADFLERCYSLKPKNKIAIAYSSYGYVKTHLERIEARLKEAEFEVLDIGSFAEDRETIKATIISTEVTRVLKEKLSQENPYKFWID